MLGILETRTMEFIPHLFGKVLVESNVPHKGFLERFYLFVGDVWVSAGACFFDLWLVSLGLFEGLDDSN
jgi:hypothetical protein